MPRRRASEDEWEDERMMGGQQRNAANARERARMRVLSRAFCRLKTTLPWVPADTKLSKLDTLRLATSYIAHLRAILCLDQDDELLDQTNTNVHPLNLTWPFSFQQPTACAGGQNELTSPWTENRNNASLSSSTSSSPSSGRQDDVHDKLLNGDSRVIMHTDYSDKNGLEPREVGRCQGTREQYRFHYDEDQDHHHRRQHGSSTGARLHNYYDTNHSTTSYSDSLLQIG